MHASRGSGAGLNSRRAATAGNQQRLQSPPAKRPWYRNILLCCLAGSAQPDDIRDPYEQQESGQAVPTEAITAVAGTASAAGPSTASEPAASATALQAVGVTSNLLDESLDDSTADYPGYHGSAAAAAAAAAAGASQQHSYVPVAFGGTTAGASPGYSSGIRVQQIPAEAAGSIHQQHWLKLPSQYLPFEGTAPAATPPTALTTSDKPSSATTAAATGIGSSSSKAAAPTAHRSAPPAPAAVPEYVGGSGSGADTVAAKDQDARTAVPRIAHPSSSSSGGGGGGGGSSSFPGGVSGLKLPKQQQQQQQQPGALRPSLSPHMSPSCSPRTSPFTDRQQQRLVVAELTGEQHTPPQPAATAGAGADLAVAAGPLLDSSMLPALPGLRVRTALPQAGTNNKDGAAAAAASAADGRSKQAGAGSSNVAPGQHSAAGATAAGAAGAGVTRDTSPTAVRAPHTTTSPPSPRIVTNLVSNQPNQPNQANQAMTYSARMPPKSPAFNARLSGSYADNAGANRLSQSSSSGNTFQQSSSSSGGGQLQSWVTGQGSNDSTSQGWAQAGSSNNSGSAGTSYHTAPSNLRALSPIRPGMQQLPQAAAVGGLGVLGDGVLGAEAGLGQEGLADAAGFQGFHSGSLSGQLAKLGLESSSSSPFVKQQRQQQQQQGDDDDGSSSEEDQSEWNVVPVALSPLRIPHQQHHHYDGLNDIDTPRSPKASVVGVSNSVINNLLSEDGIPLVSAGSGGSGDSPTGTPRDMYTPGFRDLCVTPRVSLSRDQQLGGTGSASYTSYTSSYTPGGSAVSTRVGRVAYPQQHMRSSSSTGRLHQGSSTMLSGPRNRRNSYSYSHTGSSSMDSRRSQADAAVTQLISQQSGRGVSILAAGSSAGRASGSSSSAGQSGRDSGGSSSSAGQPRGLPAAGALQAGAAPGAGARSSADAAIAAMDAAARAAFGVGSAADPAGGERRQSLEGWIVGPEHNYGRDDAGSSEQGAQQQQQQGTASGGGNTAAGSSLYNQADAAPAAAGTAAQNSGSSSTTATAGPAEPPAGAAATPAAPRVVHALPVPAFNARVAPFAGAAPGGQSLSSSSRALGTFAAVDAEPISTTAANLVHSGALFSRSGWASLDRQHSSGQGPAAPMTL